jgi:hypothetical protein
MAKRAAPDEKPFRPLLDADLVSAAISPAGPSAAKSPPTTAVHASSAKVLEMPRTEAHWRAEPAADPGRQRLPELSSSSADIDRSSAGHGVVKKFNNEKRILFTRPESLGLDRLAASLAMRLNSQVKVSHVIRALVHLLLNAEAEIDRRAGESGPLVRPANGDAQALQRFEKDIGRIIGAALRDVLVQREMESRPVGVSEW